MADDAHGIPCMLMRGGTSKGAYFVAADLPADADAREDLLLRIMGSPDPTQIDGLGGAHPLTSKVAIVSAATDDDVDLDYLFLQIGVDQAVVGLGQTCGNLLAGVAPFAIERGLVAASGPETTVRIRLVNTGDIATATIATPSGAVTYDGDTRIDGVPGTAGRIGLEVTAAPGRGLLPTGEVVNFVAGHHVTLIDNGMPVVLMDAADLGITGDETVDELEADTGLAVRVEAVRLAAGPLMGLGDVADRTVPKMLLLSPPRNGGHVCTRAFIPTRVHRSIGVLMAASVAAGIRIPGGVGSALATRPDGASTLVEHPSGVLDSAVEVTRDDTGTWRAVSLSVRTARKIFDGHVFPRPRL